MHIPGSDKRGRRAEVTVVVAVVRRVVVDRRAADSPVEATEKEIFKCKRPVNEEHLDYNKSKTYMNLPVADTRGRPEEVTVVVAVVRTVVVDRRAADSPVEATEKEIFKCKRPVNEKHFSKIQLKHI